MSEEESLDRYPTKPGRTWIGTALIVAALLVAGVVTCVVGSSLFRLVTMRATSSMPMAQPLADVEQLVGERTAMEVPPAPPAVMATAAPAASGAPGLAQAVERLIIRTGNLSMAVADTRAAQAAVQDLVAGLAGEGAFVVSSDESGGTEGSQPYITMSIRVPAARFDDTMDRLAALAVRVNSRSESGQDVTEEYVDLAARLESMEAARDRLLQIMSEARSTKDLLEAEQQLTQREAEIESIKGRMQYLEQSAQLSSIWIELQPYLLSQPVGEQWHPLETARRAVEAFLDSLRGLADFIIVFAIAVLPWLVLLGLVIYLVVRLVRGRMRRKQEKAAEPEV